MPRISKEAAEKVQQVKQSISHPLGQLDAAVTALNDCGQKTRAASLQKIIAKLERWQKA